MTEFHNRKRIYRFYARLAKFPIDEMHDLHSKRETNLFENLRQIHKFTSRIHVDVNFTFFVKSRNICLIMIITRLPKFFNKKLVMEQKIDIFLINVYFIIIYFKLIVHDQTIYSI